MISEGGIGAGNDRFAPVLEPIRRPYVSAAPQHCENETIPTMKAASVNQPFSGRTAFV
jgi:hypothetical protein